MKKNLLALLLILFLATVLRLLWLDKVPHSVNGDQMHYILSAKSFFITGKDVTQTTSLPNIFFFQYPPGELVQAELPYLLEFLAVGLFPFSLLAVFFPNALLGIGTVFLIYLITKKLINEEIALMSSFIAAVNPWFIFIGRTSYEMIPATFFYLCSLYVLLITKGWKILYALPLFLLAFYSYIGTKIILLPIAVVFVLYCYFVIHKKKFIKQYSILLALLTIFIFFYAYQITHTPGVSRLSEIAAPGSTDAASYVDAIRKTSITTPLLPLFENKGTVFIDEILKNISTIFSLEYLFLNGDYFASLGRYGLFYPIEFIFLLVGGGWLFAHKKRILIFFIPLILLSIIPQLIHHSQDGSNFTPHITLLFPFFIIIMGAGLWQLFHVLKNKIQYVLSASILLVYAFSIGNFLNIYFFQMPLQQDSFNFSNRLVSEYISRSQNNGQQIVIYASNPENSFKDYIFYNNFYNKDTANPIKRALDEKKYTLDKVTFISCNKDIKNVSKDVIIAQAQCAMSFANPSLKIPQLSDSGASFQIYNDKICEKHNLNPYISNLQVKDFSIKNLSSQMFCEKFIIK